MNLCNKTLLCGLKLLRHILWNFVQVSSIINLICVGQLIYKLREIQFQRADLLPRRFPFTNESSSKSHSLVVLSSLWSSSIISSKPPNNFCAGTWVRIDNWGRGGGDLEFTFDSGSANKRRPSQGNFQCSSVVSVDNITNIDYLPLSRWVYNGLICMNIQYQVNKPIMLIYTS